MYITFVAVFSTFMIYRVAPKYGTKNPMVYLSICSLVGSVSVMSIKVTPDGQRTHPAADILSARCQGFGVHSSSRSLGTISLPREHIRIRHCRRWLHSCANGQCTIGEDLRRILTHSSQSSFRTISTRHWTPSPQTCWYPRSDSNRLGT